MIRPLMMVPIVAVAMLTGCEREAPAPPAAKAQQAVTDAKDAKTAADADIAADRKAADVAKAAADAKVAADAKAAQATADATKEAADAKVAADRKAADVAKDAADAKIASDATVAKAAADDNTAKATTLLAQLTQYIKDNKLDLAEKTLDQLDGMKGSLPASLQTQIEAARGALKAKKAAAAFK